jgi:ADP-heptose:LPS heptosyltransferase
MLSRVNGCRGLIIRTGPLGDFLVTLPALAVVTKTWRQRRFTDIQIMTQRSHGDLALSTGLVDKAIDLWDGNVLADMITNGPDARIATAYLDQFDVIVTFINDPKDVLPRLKLKRAVLQSCQSPNLMARVTTHATTAALAQLQRFGYNASLYEPVLKVKGCKQYDEPYVHIHPGSGYHKHNLPIDVWQLLIDELRSRKMKIVVSGINKELTRLSQLTGVDRQLIDQPLTVVAASMSYASMYLGQDSGATHLASFVGARGLVFWPPDTISNTWKPWSHNLKMCDIVNTARPNRALIMQALEARLLTL